MATPPHSSQTEVDAAVGRILRRHERIDDPRRSGLGTEPRDLLDHLTRHSIGLPRWVAAADTQDALVLHTWLWWEDRRRERALLRRGLRRGLHLGLTLGELGGPLGIGTRQGLRDRLDRLDALLAFDRPDEKLSRTSRRDATAQDRRQRWIETNRDRVCTCLTTLLVQVERLPAAAANGADDAISAAAGAAGSASSLDAEEATDTESWLEELRADVEDDELTPATLSMLGLALPPLRIAARQAGLDPAHLLMRTLREADQLRADFARASD